MIQAYLYHDGPTVPNSHTCVDYFHYPYECCYFEYKIIHEHSADDSNFSFLNYNFWKLEKDVPKIFGSNNEPIDMTIDMTGTMKGAIYPIEKQPNSKDFFPNDDYMEVDGSNWRNVGRGKYDRLDLNLRIICNYNVSYIGGGDIEELEKIKSSLANDPKVKSYNSDLSLIEIELTLDTIFAIYRNYTIDAYLYFLRYGNSGHILNIGLDRYSKNNIDKWLEYYYSNFSCGK
jgi:hypothetical protein